jgi:hypothetical protein
VVETGLNLFRKKIAPTATSQHQLPVAAVGFSNLNFYRLLPNNDLLQQFEDYVIELRCEKGRRKEKKEKKIQ